MKRKSIIKKQAIMKRRKGKRQSSFLKLISFVGGCFTKFSLLLIGLTVISAMFITAYEYLLTSPYLELENVIITGVGEGLKKDLLEASGLKRGVSLLAIEVEQVRQRMEDHPWVRAVRIERHFPHTLVAKVEREEPRALVLLGKLYYMNRWGEVFKSVDEDEDANFPVITGLADVREMRDNSLKDVARVVNFLESEKGRWSVKELAEIHVERDRNISLYFDSLPASVELNYADIGSRMADLKKVVEHLKTKGSLPMVKRIDLNYPDGAVVSFKKG